jgi:putative uncharacterized protein (fragment)
MIEGEFLVEAKEYKLSAIRCMLCVALWIWSVILPWIPLVSVPVTLAFILAALHFARYKKEPKWLLRNIEWLRTFYVWLGALAILGGTWAFFLPIAINSGFNKNDDGPVLRQLLIYTTGGLLGAITLGETRRKNDQEHMRQVHAERRSRYTKAIEQLADEKAPIRLGGVYTLAKLVDEWLADEKTLPSEEERHQEGQIIIDSLCTYIRSSFPLAERHDELTLSYEEYQQNRQGNQDLHSPQAIPLPKPKNAKQSREEFIRDKSLFQEEQEVRKTILSEIKNRLNGGKPKNKDDRDEIKPGTWSYFEYDFSNAVFFYDVKFNKVNFAGKKTSFSATKFIQQADFSGTTFHEVTDFSEAHFNEIAKFSEATFTQRVDFSNTVFTQKAKFDSATFKYISSFFKAIFGDDSEVIKIKISLSNNHEADFSNAYFYEEAEFSLAKFSVHTIFSRTIFHKGSKFRGTKLYTTSFNGTVFTGRAVFESTKFGRPATSGNIDKFYDIMGITDFSNAMFIEGAYFFRIIIGLKIDFSNTQFARGSKNEFSVYEDICIIKTKKHRSPDGTITTIPKGCIVFDSKTGEEIPHTPAPNGSV